MENNKVLNNNVSSVSDSKKKSKNKHRYDYLWIASYNIRVVVFRVPLQELYKNAIL